MLTSTPGMVICPLDARICIQQMVWVVLFELYFQFQLSEVTNFQDIAAWTFIQWATACHV